jgi:hypothetical protein
MLRLLLLTTQRLERLFIVLFTPPRSHFLIMAMAMTIALFALIIVLVYGP